MKFERLLSTADIGIGGGMAEHRYTREERIEQLHALERALVELIPVVEATPEAASFTGRYIDALESTKALLGRPFDQEDLSTLSRSIPDVFPRHKDWMPPLQRTEDGHWQEAEWFKRLDGKLLPVLDVAAKLRVIGFY
jgi:PAS domain-containing protein